MLHILNDRNQYLVNRNWFVSGRFEHQLTNYLRYSVDAGMSRKHSERYDDYFGNDWRKWSDSLAVARHTNGRVQYQNSWRSEYDYSINGFSFERNGSLNNPWYFKQDQRALFGRLDLQAALGSHRIRLGLDARSYLMRNYEVNTIDVKYLTERYGSESFFPDMWLRELQEAHNFGYDALGHKIEKGFNGPKKPLFASAYLEDRIIHKNAVFTFGLRYDYFDTDDNVLLNPGSPKVNEAERLISDDGWKDKKPVLILQPRFGLSLFPGSGSQFYFSYGKYAQPPKSSLYYYNSNEYGKQIVSYGNFYFNRVGFNLNVVKATVGKIGYKKVFSEMFDLNINLFYKTAQELPQIRKSMPGPNEDVERYYSIQNGGHSLIRGLNLKIFTKRKKRLQAEFNYTFQNVTGTGSYANSQLISKYYTYWIQIPEHPLDYAVAHKAVVNLDYRFDKDDGGTLLEQLGLNLLFRFNSGHPFTLDSIPAPG